MNNYILGALALILEIILIFHLYKKIKKQEESKNKADLNRKLEKTMQGFRIVKDWRKNE